MKLKTWFLFSFWMFATVFALIDDRALLAVLAAIFLGATIRQLIYIHDYD